MNKYEKISSLLWLLFSAAIIAYSLSYPFGTWRNPGPGFLPFWCGIIMAGLSSIIFIHNAHEKKDLIKEREGRFFTSRWPHLIIMLIILFSYPLMLETLGFIITTFLFLILIFKIIEPMKWGLSLISSGSITIISYILFELFLKVPMPKGIMISYLF